MADRKKMTLDFFIKSSPGILYDFMTQPSRLIEWFADEVDLHEGIYTFEWDGSVEKGELLETEENSFIRFHLDSHEDEEFLEFKITKAEISNDTILIITDFVDEDDEEDQQELWESQIDVLRGCVGGSN